jgi:capsid protein
VDPLKEANANNLDEAAGRKSVVESIMENGRDPVDVLAEESWYEQEREKRGLAPVNRNVKPDASGAEGESEGGGTADDRDGDGVPREDEREEQRRRRAQPEGAE